MKLTNKKTIKKNVLERIRGKKTFAAGSREGQIFASVPYTSYDFKNAMLIVSLVINVFFLTLWLTLQLSDTYAFSLAQYLVR